MVAFVKIVFPVELNLWVGNALNHKADLCWSYVWRFISCRTTVWLEVMMHAEGGYFWKYSSDKCLLARQVIALKHRSVRMIQVWICSLQQQRFELVCFSPFADSCCGHACGIDISIWTQSSSSPICYSFHFVNKSFSPLTPAFLHHILLPLSSTSWHLSGGFPAVRVHVCEQQLHRRIVCTISILSTVCENVWLGYQNTTPRKTWFYYDWC